jgi:hypothetical protein
MKLHTFRMKLRQSQRIKDTSSHETHLSSPKTQYVLWAWIQPWHHWTHWTGWSTLYVLRGGLAELHLWVLRRQHFQPLSPARPTPAKWLGHCNWHPCVGVSHPVLSMYLDASCVYVWLGHTACHLHRNCNIRTNKHHRSHYHAQNSVLELYVDTWK